MPAPTRTTRKPATRPAAEEPAPAKTVKPAGEKILSETTSDNPSYATPTVEASAPIPSPVEQKKAFLLDQKTGRYTRQVVTAADLAEPPDRFSHDPMGLGEDWDKGRGKEMHAHWANANPRWRNTEN